MPDKKGGARASKFMKTVNRASRISQETPQEPPQIEEVVEEQAQTAAPVVDPVEATDLVETAGKVNSKAAEVEKEPEKQTPTVSRNTGRGRRNRAKQRSRPEKPVRITVDLNAERHRFLRDYAFREETKGTAVIRALLDELQENPELSERLGERLLDPDTS